MAIDTSDSHDRLSRAKKLLSELDEEINNYVASNPIKIDLVPDDGMIASVNESGELVLTPDRYAQAGKENILVLRASIEKKQSKQINIMLGDVIENIRICYEYLAQSIGRDIGMSNEEFRKIHYPSTKLESGVDAEILKYFKGYEHLDIVKKIKDTEPFFNGKFNIKEVAELSNLNKHRKPISLIGFAGGFPVSIGNGLSIGNMTIGIDPLIGYADITKIHKNHISQISYSQPIANISIDFSKINTTKDEFDTPAYDYVHQCIRNAEEVVRLFE